MTSLRYDTAPSRASDIIDGLSGADTNRGVSGTVAQWMAAGGAVPVTAYGAKGDGVTDDTAAFNAALLAHGRVFAPPGEYLVTTIMAPSRTTLEGAGKGCTKIFNQIDAPVIASRNYFAATGASATGRTVIRGLDVDGSNNSAHTNNHGILLRDYYSTIDDCVIRETGGSAIRLTHLNDAASAVAGTLVQNRVTNIDCFGILGQNCIDLGPDNNGKLTDGFCLNVNIQHSKDNTQRAIFAGSAAGWQFRGIHTYGSVPDQGLRLRYCDKTHVSDLFIETFTSFGLFMHVVSTGSVSVDGIIVSCSDAGDGDDAVRIEAASGNPAAKVGRISAYRASGSGTVNALAVQGGTVATLDSPPALSGAGASGLRLYDVSSGSTIRVPRLGVVADAGNASYTSLNGATTSHIGTVRYASAITADRNVDLPTGGLYEGLEFEVVRASSATGAFAVNIGTGPVKALSSAGTWARVRYTGAAWVQVAGGSL